MARNATISRLFTAVGALAAGTVIPTLGLPACFLGSAVIFAVATIVGLFMVPGAAPPNHLRDGRVFVSPWHKRRYLWFPFLKSARCC